MINLILFLLCNTSIIYALDSNNAFNKNCTEKNSRSVCGDQLICLNNTCTNCQEDIQCSSSGNILCKSVTDITNPNITNICEHKNIFEDGINYFDIICIIFVFLTSVLCSISGIGGGAFMVFFIFLILEFSISVAARLSSAVIFGISIGNLLTYMPQRHPYQNKPMIDYEATLILSPHTLAGSVFGVIINIVFPGWLITLFLIAILIFVGIKVISRFKKLHQADDITEINIDNFMDERNQSSNSIVNNESPIQVYQNYFVLPHNAILVLCWAIIVVFSLLKGSRTSDSTIGVEFCSGVYWGLSIIQVISVIGIGLSIGFYLNKKYLIKQKNGTNFRDGDIKWDKINSILVVPPILFVCGIIATGLGLGGGIIRTPIMVHWKMLPDVMISTSGYNLIFTSSISIVQYFVFGILPLDYSIVLVVTGFIASVIGHLIIGFWIHKSGKPKYLVLILGILLFVLVGIALGFGIYRVVIDIQDGVYMGFNALC
jgi:uncharacterized membrane protein YfcA